MYKECVHLNIIKMKLKYYALLAIVMVFTFGQLLAATEPADVPAKKTEELTEAEIEARLVVMRARVKEIKEMDKSDLTKVERKALRKELRDMNKQARQWGSGGIYLSVGAVIIIILLLILIL